jgi:hypothetical protein
MPYFVTFSTGRYDGEQTEMLESEQLVIELLNRHAGNPEFKFDVIEGHRVMFEPVTVAVQYQRARKKST